MDRIIIWEWIQGNGTTNNESLYEWILKYLSIDYTQIKRSPIFI